MLKNWQIIKQIEGFSLLIFFIFIIPCLHFSDVFHLTSSQTFAFISLGTGFFSFLLIYRIKTYKGQFQLGILQLSVFKVSLIFIIVIAISILFAINQKVAAIGWFKVFTFYIIFILFSVFLSTKNKFIEKAHLVFTIIAIAILIFSISFNTNSDLINFYSQGDLSFIEKVNSETISMFGNNRLAGVGVSNWKIKIGDYHLSPDIYNSNNGSLLFPSNIIYIIISETGIAGLLMYFAMLIISIYYTIASIKFASTLVKKIISFIPFFGLVISVATDVFFFSPDSLGNNIFLAFFLSMITVNYFQAKSFVPKIKRSSVEHLFILFSLLLLAGIYISIIRSRSEQYFVQAQKLEEMNNWSGVIHEINKVSEYFYPLNNAAMPVKLLSAKAWNELNDPGSAIIELKAALTENPFYPAVILEIIKTYELLDKQKRANKYAEKYIELYPDQHNVFFKLCRAYLQDNDYKSTYKLLRSKNSLSEYQEYQDLLNQTLKQKIFNLLARVRNDNISDILNSINATESWILSIYDKSVAYGNEFEKQVLMDCIFILENEKKIISGTEAATLKTQYGLY